MLAARHVGAVLLDPAGRDDADRLPGGDLVPHLHPGEFVDPDRVDALDGPGSIPHLLLASLALGELLRCEVAAVLSLGPPDEPAAPHPTANAGQLLAQPLEPRTRLRVVGLVVAAGGPEAAEILPALEVVGVDHLHHRVGALGDGGARCRARPPHHLGRHVGSRMERADHNGRFRPAPRRGPTVNMTWASLALGVGTTPAEVVLDHHVAEIDRGLRPGRHVHNARRRAGEETRHEHVGEQKGGEVVHLKAVLVPVLVSSRSSGAEPKPALLMRMSNRS